jgi:glycosyltransferase involved in cell wall biosynthesis
MESAASAPLSAPRVALDVRETSHMSAGMIRYVRELAARLPVVAPDLTIVPVGRGDNFGLAEQAALPLAARRSTARLLHVPSPYVPLVPGLPFVVTIHDLIDLHYPAFGKKTVGPYYRYVVAPVARRARAVITDDEATARDLERFLRVPRAKIRIVPLGVDGPGRIPAVRRARPYFFNVGNHRPHKNLDVLVRAWAALPPDYPADLLLTGIDDAVLPTRRRPGNAGEVLFLGNVSEADLEAHYRGAAAYVHPALIEGFGLPMLEAMRAGAPVIASHGALPTVLAPHAFAFESDDPDELRALLVRALQDRDRFRTAAEAAQAATAYLTWERTARATAAIYREFVA